MNKARIPLLLLTHLAVFVFFLQLGKSLSLDPFFQACRVDRTCGDLNISFPFYIDGQQPYCGSPGFQVSCLDNTTTITISDKPFIIHQIFYQNQTLRVSNDIARGCRFLIQGPIFPSERFQLALPSSNGSLFFLSNCSTTLPRNLLAYKINCSDDDDDDKMGPVLAISERDPNEADATAKCKTRVEAPIERKEDGGSNEIGEELVRRGLMLKWIASDCSVCQDSGGKCGFNVTDYHFKCFCPDRPHAKHCISSN